MRGTRRGVTLVEILVVLGIIALLLAILIPAVQRSRESARKATCQNNLRQQVLAVHAFESAYQRLPSLYNGAFQQVPRSVMYEFHHHSWRTAILPQLERRPLFGRLDLTAPPTIAANQSNLNVMIPTFQCPSTSNPAEIVPWVGKFNDGNFAVESVGTAARSDYEAVGGFQFNLNPPPVDTAQTGPLSGVRFGAWGEPHYDLPNYTGTALSYRTARFRDVTDGLSNTLLIGELAGRPDEYEQGRLVDAYPPEDPNTGMDVHAAIWGISTHFLWLVGYAGVNTRNHRGLYSFHDSGANAAFADGSVRFLSEHLDVDMLGAMSTRASGDLVAFP